MDKRTLRSKLEGFTRSKIPGISQTILGGQSDLRPLIEDYLKDGDQVWFDFYVVFTVSLWAV